MTPGDEGEGEQAFDLLIPPALDPDRLVPDAALEMRSFGGDTMGTSWSVVAALPASMDVEPLRAKLEAGFADIVAQMSQWEPTSQLSRYNAAPAGSWHAISPQFAVVVRAALDLCRASGGAFDARLGHASEAWGFGASGAHDAAPDEDAVAALKDRGRAALQYDADRGRLYQPGGLALDLSGIAKGFAVDHASALLDSAGVGHALVEIGGELRGRGVRPDGQPWWVDVEATSGVGPARIALSNWAVATSGHYLRRRAAKGRSWSHSIDPATARPIADDIAAVTVVHPSCMMADGLATAIAVLGTGGGIDFADRHRIAARIAADGRAITSSAWRKYAG